ncbi:hypothetical protein ACWGE0_14205 [Lentzea sp. NPDC054927]
MSTLSWPNSTFPTIRERAHFAELTRPGGRELQPADTYDARDPSGFVIVTVNKDRKVTNVRIRPRWYEHLRPEHFPAALYNTYVTAVQRAFAVEFAHRPPDQPGVPASDAGFVDPADLSQEEWEARTSARINAMADQYDAIRGQQQHPKQLEVTDIRSPLGYLTLHMRAGGPVAIHGDPRRWTTRRTPCCPRTPCRCSCGRASGSTWENDLPRSPVVVAAAKRTTSASRISTC